MTNFAPWEHFSPWNFRHDITLAIPEVIYDEENAVSKDFQVIYFNRDNEKNLLRDTSSKLLYGRNFTKEELINCSTARENISIADALERLVSSDTNYLVLNINSHIVGLPFELLSRDSFQNVVFYTNYYRESMLIQNINIFNYANKSIVLGDYNSSLIDKRMQGCIVIIEDIREYSGNKYINPELTLELEEFIAINSSVVYIFLLQFEKEIYIDGYETKFVEGYSLLLNKDFNVLPVSNNGGLNYFTDLNLRNMLVKSLPAKKYSTTLFSENVNKSLKDEFGEELLEFKVPYYSSMPEGSWKNFITKLNKVLPQEETKGFSEKINNYYKWILTFVKILLGECEYPDSSIRDIALNILSQENRKRYWVPAIINESYNAENNYEQLETLGDKVLGSTFSIYLMAKMPKITSGALNNLNDFFMSKHNQGNFCQELGLSNWILSNFPLNNGIYEDVFESFSGALYLAAENAKKGLGSILLYKFIEILFEDKDVTCPETALGNVVMIMDQYAGRLNVPIFITHKYVIGQTFYDSIRLNPDEISFFIRNGVDRSKISSKEFVGKGSDVDIAKLESRTKMYNYLKSIGVTYEWVEDYRTNRKLLSNKKNKELSAQAKTISAKQGYVKIIPVLIEKYQEYIGGILKGITKDDKKVILSWYYLNKDNNLGNSERKSLVMTRILQDYIDSNTKKK